jgi:hypothetical protein
MRGERFLFLLFIPLPASAQLVTGRVLEQGTTTPVGGAQVEARAGDLTARTTVTDSTGAFRIVLSIPGRYSLRVQHVAYAAYTSEPLEIGRDETVSVEVRLGRDVIPLEPIVVLGRSNVRGRLAEFRERAATNAFGRFITRDEIDRRPTAAVSDFFRSIPGVSVVATRRGGNPDGLLTQVIMMRGHGNEPSPLGADGAAGLCQPAVWLDGVRIQQSSSHPLDNMLMASTLEGIEVYSSAASAPIEYQGQANCGVILLWSRESTGGSKWGWKRMVAGGGLLAFIVIFGFF